MLLDTPNPYPPKEVKDFQAWIRQPSAVLFERHLTDLAALLTSKAGNLVVSNEQGDLEDAQEIAGKARVLIEMVTVMTNIRNDRDYMFHGYIFAPKPINTATKENTDANKHHEVSPDLANF